MGWWLDCWSETGSLHGLSCQAPRPGPGRDGRASMDAHAQAEDGSITRSAGDGSEQEQRSQAWPPKALT